MLEHLDRAQKNLKKKSKFNQTTIVSRARSLLDPVEVSKRSVAFGSMMSSKDKDGTEIS